MEPFHELDEADLCEVAGGNDPVSDRALIQALQEALRNLHGGPSQSS